MWIYQKYKILFISHVIATDFYFASHLGTKISYYKQAGCPIFPKLINVDNLCQRYDAFYST